MMRQKPMAVGAQVPFRNSAFRRNRLRIASVPRTCVEALPCSRRVDGGLASSSIADGSWPGGFRGPFLCV